MILRYLLLFTLCLSLNLNAQSKDEIAAKEFFWGASDNYKGANDIPSDWENESAVIIYKNENYDFHKFGKNVTYTTSIRKRIKLLDMADLDGSQNVRVIMRFTAGVQYGIASKLLFWMTA